MGETAPPAGPIGQSAPTAGYIGQNATPAVQIASSGEISFRFGPQVVGRDKITGLEIQYFMNELRNYPELATTKVTVLIDKKHRGLVLGSKGYRIKRFQQVFGVDMYLVDRKQDDVSICILELADLPANVRNVLQNDFR